ncbi:MAG: YqeG family HAD IIIA-type phosphatase [Actinomycetota bacterium]|nr:YqeG family HAD IIIA-type phosphatase [Actinomycetota bacterium]
MSPLLERFRPDGYHDSIFDVDMEELKRGGITGLVVDLDNTLVPRYEREAPEQVHKWLEGVIERGFKVCIVSNNWAGRVKTIADELGLSLVAPAGKPRSGAFVQAMEILGTSRSQTAVIGDQLFTDILGGNLAGLVTILVVPISPREPLHTRILRRLERIVLRRLQKKDLLRKYRASFPDSGGGFCV